MERSSIITFCSCFWSPKEATIQLGAKLPSPMQLHIPVFSESLGPYHARLLEATLTALMVARPPAKDLLVHQERKRPKEGGAWEAPLALRLKSRCEAEDALTSSHTLCGATEDRRQL